MTEVVEIVETYWVNKSKKKKSNYYQIYDYSFIFDSTRLCLCVHHFVLPKKIDVPNTLSIKNERKKCIVYSQHFHFHFNRLSKRKIFRYLVIDHQKMIMMMMKNEWTSEQTSFFFWQIISGLSSSSSSDSIWSKKKKKKKSITIDLCIDQ